MLFRKSRARQSIQRIGISKIFYSCSDYGKTLSDATICVKNKLTKICEIPYDKSLYNWLNSKPIEKPKINDNGNLECDASTGTITVGNSAFFIGVGDDTRFAINGVMDNLYVWNRSLSEVERDCIRAGYCLTNWSFSQAEPLIDGEQNLNITIHENKTVSQLKFDMTGNSENTSIIFESGTSYFLENVSAGGAPPPTPLTNSTTITLIDPVANASFVYGEFNNYTVEACCEGTDDCGDVNVSLDPIIILNESNGTLLEDVDFAENAVKDGTETYINADLMGPAGGGSGEISFIKFSIGGIPVGSTIDSAVLSFALSIGSDNNLSVWYVDNQSWNEATLDSLCKPVGVGGSICPNISNMLTTKIINLTDDGNIHRLNISGLESAVQTSLDAGEVNLSFALNNTGADALDIYIFKTKEDTTVANRPFMNISYTLASGTKSGLVSTTIGATPFWTNDSNPTIVNLNTTDCQNVTWNVNATGTINSSHEFFAYVNLTNNLGVNNKTDTFNITIVAQPSGGVPSSDCVCPSSANLVIDDGCVFNITWRCTK